MGDHNPNNFTNEKQNPPKKKQQEMERNLRKLEHILYELSLALAGKITAQNSSTEAQPPTADSKDE